MDDKQLREILASCYERQMQPISAQECRGGFKTYAICAALDAMRRVASNPTPPEVTEEMVEAAARALCWEAEERHRERAGEYASCNCSDGICSGDMNAADISAANAAIRAALSAARK